MKLPKTLFVRHVEDDGSDYFVAEKELKDVVPADEGIVTVGVYQLVETRKAELVVQSKLVSTVVG